MHLKVDPKNYVAKLLHEGGMTLGTLEFETYEILSDTQSTKWHEIDSLPRNLTKGEQFLVYDSKRNIYDVVQWDDRGFLSDCFPTHWMLLPLFWFKDHD